MKTITESKEQALAEHLGVKPNEVRDLGNNLFEADGGEYLVLNDAEADEKAEEGIRESIWAFNYSFLRGHSRAIGAIPEKEFKEIQGKLCESFNGAVWAMIDDKEHFVKDAIGADGRGHFLSGYDGEESEQGEFFIYRTN